jgi:hypothetical protein
VWESVPAVGSILLLSQPHGVCGVLLLRGFAKLGAACLGPSELAQAVTLLTGIREVTGSSLIQNTSCPN